jgi:hypothetical protein
VILIHGSSRGWWKRAEGDHTAFTANRAFPESRGFPAAKSRAIPCEQLRWSVLEKVPLVRPNLLNLNEQAPLSI